MHLLAVAGSSAPLSQASATARFRRGVGLIGEGCRRPARSRLYRLPAKRPHDGPKAQVLESMSGLAARSAFLHMLGTRNCAIVQFQKASVELKMGRILDG